MENLKQKLIELNVDFLENFKKSLNDLAPTELLRILNQLQKLADYITAAKEKSKKRRKPSAK